MGLLVVDKIGLQKLLARTTQRHRVEAQEATDAGIGVEAQAPGVSDGEQKQVEGQGIGAAAGREPVSEEALVAPTEAWRDLAEAFRPEQHFAGIGHGLEKAGPRHHAGGWPTRSVPDDRSGGVCPLVAQSRSGARQAPPIRGNMETRNLVAVGLRDLVAQPVSKVPEG